MGLILVLIFFIILGACAEETPGLEGFAIVDELQEDPFKDLCVSFHFSWDGKDVHYGDKIRLVPDLYGCDGLDYYLTWQHSTDDANWIDWSGDTYTLTEDNADWYWRLVINIIIEEEE